MNEQKFIEVLLLLIGIGFGYYLRFAHELDISRRQLQKKIKRLDEKKIKQLDENRRAIERRFNNLN